MLSMRIKRGIAAVGIVCAFVGGMASSFPVNINGATVITIVNQVKLNKTKVTLCKGEALQLKVQNSKKNISWKTSNKKVATVSQSGKVKGQKKGTAVITATVGKKNLKCKITVKNCSPEATTKPIISSKPITTNKPLATNKPVATSKPVTTNKPVITNKPVVTNKPAATNKPVVTSTPGNTAALTEEQVYQSIIKMKAKYPEGMSWTNNDYYRWKGGITPNGYGCVAFAYILSDEAFGSLPAKKHTDVSKIKVGDILRISQDTHSVIVLEVTNDKIVVAEGNYNRSIHWGRTFQRKNLEKDINYILTRYPNEK